MAAGEKKTFKKRKTGGEVEDGTWFFGVSQPLATARPTDREEFPPVQLLSPLQMNYITSDQHKQDAGNLKHLFWRLFLEAAQKYIK